MILYQKWITKKVALIETNKNKDFVLEMDYYESSFNKNNDFLEIDY